MSSNSLVALAQLAVQVEQALLEAGGELTPEVEALLAVVQENLPAKVDSYRAVLDRLDLAGDYYADKAKQYQAAAKSCAKAVDRLKDNIKAAMLAMDAKTIEGEDFKFTLSSMAPKVVLTGDIPDAFQRAVIEYKPDTEAIRAALDAGQALTFAQLQPVVALRAGIRKR